MHRLGLALTLVLLLGCQSLQVHVDFDESVDFAGRTSYAWFEPPVVEVPASEMEAPEPFGRNSLLDGRVRAAVDRELQARGFRPTEEDPAFRLQYYVVLRERTKIRPAGGSYYGGLYGPFYGGLGGSISYDYQEGTLILDFIDGHTDRIAWRGWAVGANRQGYYDQAQIAEAIGKILARFPPGRAQ